MPLLTHALVRRIRRCPRRRRTRSLVGRSKRTTMEREVCGEGSSEEVGSGGEGEGVERAGCERGLGREARERERGAVYDMFSS